jgi:hypothetical protein
MEAKLKAAYKATTERKFPEALKQLLNILHTIPLIVVDLWKEVDEAKESIEVVREYVLGLKMELKRKEVRDDVTRQQAMVAYFTNCKLQRVHTRLVLSSAMVLCFKQKNYATAAHFARMLLKNSPSEGQVVKAQQVLKACKDKEDTHQLNYDFINPFVVCGAKGSAALFASSAATIFVIIAFNSAIKANAVLTLVFVLTGACSMATSVCGAHRDGNGSSNRYILASAAECEDCATTGLRSAAHGDGNGEPSSNADR